MDEAFLSQPESIAFPTKGGATAYMNHYPPASGDHRLPAGQAPPLLVKIHGGPTAAASTAFSLGIQFWTSRGAHQAPSAQAPSAQAPSAQHPHAHTRMGRRRATCRPACLLAPCHREEAVAKAQAHI